MANMTTTSGLGGREGLSIIFASVICLLISLVPWLVAYMEENRGEVDLELDDQEESEQEHYERGKLEAAILKRKRE